MWNHILLIRVIKKYIPFGFKIIIIRFLVSMQRLFYLFFPKKIRIDNTKSKRIFFLLSTDYSNLGDHAMSYAGIRFLQHVYPEFQVIEITVNDTLKSLSYISKISNSEDIICLKGGGNIGVQYFREELIRRKIIKLFNKNRLIIFPQTAYFPNTEFGNVELNNTVKIYNSHPRLLLFLRDKNSYDLLSGRIPSSYLVPDIVFTLGNSILTGCEKTNISVCLRNDAEGIYSTDFRKNIVGLLKEKYENVEVYDTIKSYYIPNENRLKELVAIWKNIEESKVLITDRLHGMIFAYLLKTPCVLLHTYNYKLTGQYEWIKKSKSIKMVDSVNNLNAELLTLIDDVIGTNDFEISDVRNKFKNMEQILRNF